MFIQENAFENVTWKTLAILSQPQYVNPLSTSEVFTYKSALNLVITEPTDGPASLSAAKLLTGLVQDCSNSSALAMELLQFCTKPVNTIFSPIDWLKSHHGCVWGEITYPFPNYNSCTIKVWEWIDNFITHIRVDVIT